jgi:host factor-I protein
MITAQIQPQTQAPSRRRSAIQDTVLTKLLRSRMAVTVFLVNGFQLRGEIRGYDPFVVVIHSDGKQQMVYKHAISTIVPAQPVRWEDNEL